MPKTAMLIQIRHEVFQIRESYARSWQGGEYPKAVQERINRLNRMDDFLREQIDAAIKEEIPSDLDT